MTVGCPVCYVEYADEPVRCESCGYRFDRSDADY